MSLNEIPPDVRSLSREDKVRLLQWLSEDLARDGAGSSRAEVGHLVRTSGEDYGAAAILLKVLEGEKAKA